MNFSFTAPLWIYTGKGAWHFVTLPKHLADEIRFFTPSAQGFAPIKVSARIEDTAWKTAIFPDSKSASYLLVIKAEIRKKLQLSTGDFVDVSLIIL